LNIWSPQVAIREKQDQIGPSLIEDEHLANALLSANVQAFDRDVRSSRWSQPVDATLYLSAIRWSVAMDQGFRRGFTAAEKTELWDRWQRGESHKAIGRAFGKPSSSIYFQVAGKQHAITPRPKIEGRERHSVTPTRRA
jgi:hypothetical protein